MASVLIIDDDVTLLARLGLQIEATGHEVVKCSTIEHGERQFIDRRPDIVILEVRSGNDRGWDLLPRMAATTPVLVLSATSREEDVVRGFELGAVDYVAKPYRSEELQTRLRVRLGGTSREPALAAAPVTSPAKPLQPASSSPGSLQPVSSATTPTQPADGKSSAVTPPPTAPTTGKSSPTPPPAAPAASKSTPATPPPAAPAEGKSTPATPPPAAPPASKSTPATPPPAAPAEGKSSPAPQPGARATIPPAPPRRAQPRRDDPGDEAVFMSEAEEMALLRMPESTGGRREQAPILEEPGAPQTMGRRMRAERQRRHLTLVQIENELKIRMSYLQAMEDEKYTLLPRGPVALQMVQAYTEYLGLESAPILNEFRSNYYVELAEPIPALGGTRLPHSLPRWLVIVVAVILALAVAIGAILYFDPSFFQNLWAQIMGLFPATQ